MAFLKKAHGVLVHRNFSPENWGNFVGQNRSVLANGPYRTASSSPNLVAQASEILGQEFDPKQYLLSHATIVASVDTEEVPNVKLGNVNEHGRTVNRKWANYRVTPETEGWINNNCFVPGTMITMADGTVRPIEEIREGDEVLSHKGRARRVRAVMRRDVDEAIFEIKPRATTDRIYATAEHPFFVFRENKCANCGIPARSKSSYNVRCATHLIGKFYCSSECWYQKKVRKDVLLAEKSGEFVEARDLTDRDFVTMPVLSEVEPVDLTLAQARLVGLFAAEGYYELDSRNGNERVGAVWAFHADEAPTLARTVCDLMRREFGVECVVREHPANNGIHVTTRTNRDAAAFFSKWVRGNGATTKTLCPSLIRAPHDVQMEIVRGWFEGDGCFQDTAKENYAGDVRVTGTSACRSLASQMQIILNRLGVASHLTRAESPGRSRLVIDGDVRVVNDPSKPPNVTWNVACGGAWIGDLVQGTVYEAPYLRAIEERGDIQEAPKFRFLNGYELQIVQSVGEVDYAGPVYNFDVEEDHSYVANGVAVHNCDSWDRPVLLKSYRTFIGAHSFVEHVQIEEQSKGRIIDAVARDIGPSVYVDILVANDRRHTSLIRDIEGGKMSTLSMGCSVTMTACTKCGNVAADETEMCPCIKYEKGNIFFDERGVRRKTAELCGHDTLDPTGGVSFIEASWVAVPAFTGAVMRNVLTPESINVDTQSQMRNVLASPPRQWTDEDGMAKAARMDVTTREAEMRRQARMTQLYRAGEEEEEIPDPMAPPPGDDAGGGAPDPMAPAPGGAPDPMAPPGGGMPGAPGGEEKDPMEELEGDIEKYVLDKIRKKIKDKLTDEISEDAATDPELATSKNENLNKQAAQLVAGTEALLRIARSDIELLDGLARLKASFGLKVSRDLYRTALRVGSTDGHESLEGYLQRCAEVLTRKPTVGEAKTLVRLGRILSLRKKTRF